MADESGYEFFFTTMQKFKNEQQQQKKDGLNDYNILTTVLNAHDEVRLHSRMIASLLDTKGLHYQDALFLDLFIESLNLVDFQLDTKNVSVLNEFQNIDIYITDGDKHLIIENKIYAGDQEKQIKRYIEKIQKLHPQTPYENIFVIYLSIDREYPSSYSLDDFKINNNQIFDKDNICVALYMKMHYKKEILEWLNKSQTKISHIPNLYEVFDQYIQVVQKITNQFKGKVMTLDSELKKEIAQYKIAMEILEDMPKMRDKIITDFFNDVIESLSSKLGDEWVVEIVGTLSKRWQYPLRIYKKMWGQNKLLFGFEFDKSNYFEGRFGIVKGSNIINMQDIYKQFAEKINRIAIDFNVSTWWLFNNELPANKDCPEKDFVELILFNDRFSVDSFVDTVLGYLNKIELNDVLLLSEINTKLD